MRPVIEGMGSLIEVREQWSLEDVFAANDALDAMARAKAKAQEIAMRKSHWQPCVNC